MTVRCCIGERAPHDTLAGARLACYAAQVMMDPYAILGVSRTASADEIRRAYRKLAKELHPDARPGDSAAEERFKQVGQAFKLLSDTQQRARFDRGEIDADGNDRAAYHFRSRPGGPAGARGPSGRFEDISDIFSDLFAGGGQPRKPGPGSEPGMRGQDLKAGVRINFEEAIVGVKRKVNLPDDRSLEITIPAGVEPGQVLRLRQQGGPGRNGGPRGDVLVEVSVRPHPYFRRDGKDVRVDLPISLKEALFGGSVRVPTVEGLVDLRVPAGANSGALLRLRGKGAPSKTGARGDQIIRLIIDVPLNDPALERFIEDWVPPKGYDPRRRFKP